MIEKDYKARCEGSRKSRITEYFPSEQPQPIKSTDPYQDRQTVIIADEEAIAQLADEPIDFEDEFSDGDFSLPDIEELLRGY